jgi:hypothetical protein
MVLRLIIAISVMLVFAGCATGNQDAGSLSKRLTVVEDQVDSLKQRVSDLEDKVKGLEASQGYTEVGRTAVEGADVKKTLDAADRAERAASRAERAARKAEKAFELQIRK